ncbi:anaerobic ribonucleoside-triphosphate reductase activating protein [Desulfosarcina sp. OttesenSCG-928-A07]|nr:anaerobic ribonucleoside-triphosphate reductase activating protein [Desulfosarcina sp. OttesenSCG-928-G17]MDL2328758.1 anaerobic ribonucleoside-triphosphate reductase activating protein [Desulfosarcina sp. OttesenSCG-928-A07]
MILAGIQKNSFIDYPGKISCVLFVSGCNFFCPYCHNSDLAKGKIPAPVTTGEAIAFLESRQGMLEGVVITGGEPLLSPFIEDLCRILKAIGYPVKIDTNGSRPDALERLLDQHLVDFVAMDIKAPLDQYGFFCREPDITDRLKESIRLIMTAAPAYEFRTTCVSPFVDDVSIIAMARAIEGADCYALQKFNPQAVCLNPSFGQETDPALSSESMARLQSLSAAFVRRCLIR